MRQDESLNIRFWKTNSELIKTQPRPENAYFSMAYDFMRCWIGGQESFELQTSGSTGIPKMIQVTRNQLRSSAAMTGQALDLKQGTSALVCLNIAYVAGLMMLVRGMELHWDLTVTEPSGNPLLNIGLQTQFDFVALVPLQLAACMENEETSSRINNFGKILLGGAPVGIALLRQVGNLNIPVYQSYGMTETVSHVALRRLNGTPIKEDYEFLPGVEAGTDERGCLHVSGSMTNGEKIQTNDLAEFTSDTSFKWLGRIDNVINSGGVKIILDLVDEQIAKVFYELNYPAAFFTWFVQDEKLGQKLILIIEKTDGNLPESLLLAEIRKTVSVYETPKHVYFANQFLKTQTDKTDKSRTAKTLFTTTNG